MVAVQGTGQQTADRRLRRDRRAHSGTVGRLDLDFELYRLTGPADLLAAPLSSSAKLIYLVLANCFSNQTEGITVAIADLARRLNMCRQTLYRRILELAQTGWVEIASHGPNGTRLILRNPVLSERHAELGRVRTRLGRAQFGGEALMKEWLNLLVDSAEYDDNARPGFLRNPLTGENLEYDRWYAAGVAFEFNGPQHYHPTDVYPDLRQVEATQARDLMKKGISQEHGVVLITVEPQDLTLEGMRAKIGQHLPLRKIRHDDPVLLFLTEVSGRYVFKATGEVRRKKCRFG